jgi:radical SAM protein with 4Fe4S-binding SPASM domain
MKYKIISCKWEITDKCNLKCIHCLVRRVKRKRELSTSEVLTALENLQRHGLRKLELTGGEPLLRRDIFHILEYCKKKGIEVDLITNGTLIDKYVVKKLKKVANRIYVSLDGPNSKINDAIRGKGSFRKTLKGIKLLIKERIDTVCILTLNKINISHLNSYYNFLKKLGIKKFLVNTVVLRGIAWKNRKKLSIKLKEILRIFSKRYKVEDKCDAKLEEIFISPNGDMYLCSELYQKRPSLKIGNALTFTDKNLEYGKSLLSYKGECSYRRLYSPQLAIDLYCGGCSILRNFNSLSNSTVS